MNPDLATTGLISSEDRIDELCDAFEAAWLRGERPRIDAFLVQADQAQRDTQFYELLLVELEYRLQRGERPSRDEYVRAFPKFAAQIEAVDFKHGRSAFASTLAANDDTVRIVAHTRGSRIAHFELQERLGAGAAGEVWKAWDTRLDRPVAIKLPRAQQLSEVDLHRFLREGRAAAQLRHPRLACVHEAGRDGDTVYIVADYVPGENLRQYLATHRLDHRAVAELCAEVAEALHHAHEQGVIHRDLKPANIIIDPEGHPHVIDFGLAKWSSDARELTLQGELLGTPAYMAPEQARGDTDSVGRRTDLYALGAILYEMLTGRCPHTGDQAAVLHAIITHEPTAPRTLDRSIARDLETICLKALDKQPERRYPTTQELAVDLRRFARDESILARRVGRLEKGWRWLRRRPAVAASIALTFVALVAFGFIAVLAEKNQSLLGLKTVKLRTNPPGAKAAFVALSETTGEPDLSAVTYAQGTTPVHVKLKPGDYLVVVVMADGRFHEVFRRVPRNSKTEASGDNHSIIIRRDANGIIELPRIEIPDLSVVDGMALIAGDSDFKMGVAESIGAGGLFQTSTTESSGTMGIAASTATPEYHCHVESFYIDTAEFTIGDCKRVGDGRYLPRQGNAEAEDKAMSANYDSATAIAEKLGKRLPTEIEYEFAATARGTAKYPWGDELPELEGEEDFGPVRSPALDRLPSSPPVYGLCSNKAEWTSTWAILYPPLSRMPNRYASPEYRIVRGGDLSTLEGNAAVSPSSRNPRQRWVVSRSTDKPGLGFRCARSAKPLVSYDEIP